MTLQPFDDFESAGRAVMAFLRDRLGFDLWMVTRTQGEDWIVLQTEDHGYEVELGHVFRWADSFCSQMVKGNGPRVAPESDLVPAYAAAPIGRQVDIGAYIGVPLEFPDGSLFGTLCAIDPSPQPQIIIRDQPLIEMLARLLSTVLKGDLAEVEAARRIERLASEAQQDPLTGLLNRRAWDQFLAKEDERCRRFGHSAAVLVIDLDDLKPVNDRLGHQAGDEQIRSAAQVLQTAAREIDHVARLGGDEFAILAVECDPSGAEMLKQRVQAGLHAADIKASVGLAMLEHRAGLVAAVSAADRLMYENKRARKSS